MRRWLAHAIALAWLVGCIAAPAETGAPIAGTCSTTDGDTIRCGDERIRLLGIDAPELPGHCRRGRVCAPGSATESRASLAAALSGGAVTIERVGRDGYGRTLAPVRADGVDLSCWQLWRGRAIYRSDWDDGGRVRARCVSHAAAK